MALLDFKSGNPALGEKAFRTITLTDSSSAMTMRGTMNKLGLSMLLLLAGAFYTWTGFSNNATYVQPLMWTGAIGGLVIALVIAFKKEWAPYLVPAYAILEGLFLGRKHAQYHHQCSRSYSRYLRGNVPVV